ncbi:MAG: putative ATP-binding protein [Candidatus Methanogaster sp.]|nr:MAG: putative ATP-binding protein [ANME-2 cluster archaeon]
MRRIEFHDREKEMKEVQAILDAEPSLITFIYGPINSGKTTLINHLIEELPDEYVVFYINLRTKFLSSYDDFIESLFEMEMEAEGTLKGGKEALAELVSSVTKVAGIPINKEFLDYVFKDNKPKNAFSYIIKLFEEVKNSGKQPVLILDELQKIGDAKVNGFLIYELFNFFIDLTKEKHLAHVFVATSDSLFLERVYNEAMLQGRCRYLLVDDFDEVTTTAFMGEYGFTDGEKAFAWEYCGGKPVYLVELINQKLGGGAVKEKCEDIFKVRVSQIRDLLDLLGYVTPQVLLEGTEYHVEREKVVEILKDFVDRDVVSFEGYRPEKYFMVKKNILFLDPKEGTVRPQSRLDLLAVREVLKDV